jgi:hypothetical protein
MLFRYRRLSNKPKSTSRDGAAHYHTLPPGAVSDRPQADLLPTAGHSSLISSSDSACRLWLPPDQIMIRVVGDWRDDASNQTSGCTGALRDNA